MTKTKEEPTGTSRGFLKKMLLKASDDEVRDKFLEINNDASIRGYTSIDKATPVNWAFLDPGANYLEPGAHHYGHFIGRVIDCSDRNIDLGLLAWRRCGSEDDHQRIAQLATVPLFPIQLNPSKEGDLDCSRFGSGDLVQCCARVTLSLNSLFIHFRIGPDGLRRLDEGGVANDN
jgi:hypothetical protein